MTGKARNEGQDLLVSAGGYIPVLRPQQDITPETMPKSGNQALGGRSRSAGVTLVNDCKVFSGNAVRWNLGGNTWHIAITPHD
ncbi:MAG: hypothetical protein AB7F96_14355 [Beijerinckiaceae bacterium]